MGAKIRTVRLGMAMAASAIATLVAISASAAANSEIVITSLTAGAVDPNGVIPAQNGVPGAGVDNWDIATPTAVLQNGQQFVFSASFDDISYTGTCSEEFEVSQVQKGNRVQLFGTARLGLNCAPGVGLWSTSPFVIPDSPGPVEASVKVFFGSNKVSMKIPMQIQ
jgi:hypothetical protein